MKVRTSRYLSRKRFFFFRYFTNEVALMRAVVVLALLIVSGGLWTYESAFRYRDELRIWFFDIGQGDAIFIETPDGHQILIDGGPDRDILTKLGQVMLPWDRTIDVVVGTHLDADHIGGLAAVLDRYDVRTVVSNGDKKDTSVAAGFIEARDEEADADLVMGRVGLVLRFGDVTLREIWPTETGVQDQDANVGSIVYRLDYGETSVLLTGDATESVEKEIAFDVGDIDVLKAGHHGSITSSSYDFLSAIDPEFVVISCGENNRYGHPHPVILKRFSDLLVRTFRTDQDGDILLTSGGGEPLIRAAPLPF